LMCIDRTVSICQKILSASTMPHGLISAGTPNTFSRFTPMTPR
jgi:hypothetical protein